MDEIVVALAEQQAELAALLDGLEATGWATPTPRCPGWTVRDVVLHVAQTNEMAIGSATGTYAEVLDGLTQGLAPTASIDDGADAMVERDRGLAADDVHDRWTRSSTRLIEVLDRADLHARVQWVAGTLSVRTLATTRLAETWIHTGDVADGLGVELAPAERLQHIARLAWRTLPYAFGSAGRTMHGPVAFRLLSPAGAAWDLVPDEAPVTTITGSAAELCAVAARRADPADTALVGEGPDAAAVLELVRTYA